MSTDLKPAFPFATNDLARAGLSRADFYREVREHRVRRVFRGVYVHVDVPDSRELRVQAIRLVTPPYAVVSDSSAAWLRGVETFRPSDRFDLVPSLVIPHGESRTTQRNVVCREAYIDRADVEDIDGVLVTTPLRTTIDLLRGLWRPYALAAGDGMARAGLVEAGEVVAYIRRLRGFPGVVQARTLAGFLDGRAESPAESWTRLRLLDAGLPRPEVAVPVADRNGVVRYRLDMGYEAQRIAIEYDGTEFHSDGRDRRHDQVRRDWLAAVPGYRFTVVRKDDVLGPDPSFECEVAAKLGIEPRLPRLW